MIPYMMVWHEYNFIGYFPAYGAGNGAYDRRIKPYDSFNNFMKWDVLYTPHKPAFRTHTMTISTFVYMRGGETEWLLWSWGNGGK
jgi:hypothetical protein